MVVSHLRVRLPLPLARTARSIRAHSPPLNFITLHYAYFLGVCLVSSVIFWGSSTPARSVSYTDSLFLTVSAMTLAGLNTINLSELNTFQQIILFLLIMMGSAILVSAVVVQVRRKAFERKFQAIAERKRDQSRSENGAEKKLSSTLLTSETHSMSRTETTGQLPRSRNVRTECSMDGAVTNGNAGEFGKQPSKMENGSSTFDSTIHGQGSLDIQANGLGHGDHGNQAPSSPYDDNLNRTIRFSSQSTPIMSPLRARAHSRVFSMQGVGARGDLLNHPRRASISLSPYPRTQTEEKPENGFLTAAFIGRNSQFHNLTLGEREHLGGVEYRAITLLAVIVPVYFVLWQLLGSLGVGAYIARNRASTTLQNGINPWWTGAFNAVSAFNNSGMSLLDANMVAFQTSEYMLITMGLMILAGNTCYPVFLRLIIWTIHRLLPDSPALREHRMTLRFLLDHPRRCYTNLFPSTHTWWLLGTIVLLNSIDWGAFELLNIGNTSIQTLPRGTRVLDGLFQALAVRSGGFYVVSIANLRIGLLVLYVLMMYISVYPVVITMRNSNVYEERSLGIYADESRPSEDDPGDESTRSKLLGGLRRRLTGQSVPKESRGYFVRQQLRGQLAHDLWWIVLAVLFITITETGQFESDPVDYSVFNVIFEVISAYGCVGISVGLPNVAYSFCGGWHVLSKLILCAVMIRGRHRGLPVAIDRAVLLPGEHLAAAEEEDAQIRMERTMERTMSRGQGV